VKSLLEAAHRNQGRVLLSLANLGELYYTISRRSSQTVAQEKLAQIRLLPIELVPIDEALVMAAATYKASYQLSYLNALALATAVREQVVLVTGMPEFGPLQAEFKIELLQRGLITHVPQAGRD